VRGRVGWPAAALCRAGHSHAGSTGQRQAALRSGSAKGPRTCERPQREGQHGEALADGAEDHPGGGARRAGVRFSEPEQQQAQAVRARQSARSGRKLALHAGERTASRMYRPAGADAQASTLVQRPVGCEVSGRCRSAEPPGGLHLQHVLHIERPLVHCGLLLIDHFGLALAWGAGCVDGRGALASRGARPAAARAAAGRWAAPRAAVARAQLRGRGPQEPAYATTKPQGRRRTGALGCCANQATPCRPPPPPRPAPPPPPASLRPSPPNPSPVDTTMSMA
jgi:hypothetical protein